MTNWFKNSRVSSVLGLSLDGNRIEGVVLRRTGAGAEVTASFAAPLALDPLTNEPDLVGREIRNHLEAAEIRERRCVVCLPLNWVLSLHSKIPDLPEADLAGFLAIEAERGYPCSPDTLLVRGSPFQTSDGERYMTQIAVPREHVARLQKVLRAARLTPLCLSLGLPALARSDHEAEDATLALSVSESSVGMQVTGGGGVVVLRALDTALEAEGAETRLRADVVARELRVTIGQLPAGIRDKIRRVQIFGASRLADGLAADLLPRSQALGLTLLRVTRWEAADDHGVPLPPGTELSPALALAARHLAGQGTSLDFLPPRVSAWTQLTAKYSSRKLLYAGGAAGGVAAVVAAAFLVQQTRLLKFQTQWKAMSPTVTELEGIQQQIKMFRPWFDDSFRTLSILRRLTEAFPEDGKVTAKRIEVRAQAATTCSGTAVDNAALLKTLDRLGATKEIAEVQLDQARGSPLQFTFNFQWGPAASHP